MLRFSIDPLLIGNITNTMKMVASANNLVQQNKIQGYGSDVQILLQLYITQVYGVDVQSFESGEAISGAMYDRIGTIDSAVVFNSDTDYELWVSTVALVRTCV